MEKKVWNDDKLHQWIENADSTILYMQCGGKENLFRLFALTLSKCFHFSMSIFFFHALCFFKITNFIKSFHFERQTKKKRKEICIFIGSFHSLDCSI